MKAKRLNGLHPLAYLGVEPSTPPRLVIEDRDPTDNDYKEYEMGTLWLATAITKLWTLVSKVPGSTDKWVLIYPADGSGANFFETNSGTASENAGTIKIKGAAGGVLTSMSILDQVTIALDSNLVVNNSLKVSAFTQGTLRSSSIGQFSSLPDGTDGQVLIASSSGAPIWANLAHGANVTITNAANSITIAATGGGGGGGLTGLVTDSGTAVLDGSDQITLSGSTNIVTSSPALPGTSVVISLADNITLPETNITGTTGVINIGPAFRMMAAGGSSSTNIYLGDDNTGKFDTNSVNNLGIGAQNQKKNDSSDNNISIGVGSLENIVNGQGNNICIGVASGVDLSSGENCILLGTLSGSAYQSNEANNICIGNEVTGTTGEDYVTRIGRTSVGDEQTAVYISGIYNGTALGTTNGVVIADDDHKLVASKGDLGEVLTSTATGVEWAPVSPVPPSGSDSYAFRFEGSRDLVDDEHYFLGTSAAISPTFSEPTTFYGGDGIGAPATFTAPVTGTYLFYMQSDVSSYYLKFLNIFKNGVTEPGINYFDDVHTTSYITKTKFVRLVVGDVITFEVSMFNTATGSITYVAWGYLL